VTIYNVALAQETSQELLWVGGYHAKPTFAEHGGLSSPLHVAWWPQAMSSAAHLLGMDLIG